MESQHDVFISHSSSDSKLAYAICHYLEEREIRCWIAPRDIQGGMEYAESIISAIKGSRVMVVVFSENANSSLFVKNEVERAFNYKSIIIPFKVDDTIPSATLELFLGSVHWLDAVNGKAEDYFDMLYQNCAKSIGLDFKLKKNNENTPSIPDNTQDEHILINSDEKPNIENEVSIGVENENHATTIEKEEQI
ncbi:MAG: toll/interleukin-1 receptor domain-containing protein, partial [Bacteroidota bacterium]